MVHPVGPGKSRRLGEDLLAEDEDHDVAAGAGVRLGAVVDDGPAG